MIKKREGILTLFSGFQSSFAIFTSSSTVVVIQCFVFPFFSHQNVLSKFNQKNNFRKNNRIFTLLKNQKFPYFFVEKKASFAKKKKKTLLQVPTDDLHFGGQNKTS
jgi:hypothetical protein